MQTERDAWILLIARYPEHARRWLREKRADLADPDFQRLYRGYDQALDWDPADPRVEALADSIVCYLDQRYDEERTLKDWEHLDDPIAVALLAAHFGITASPALERLNELTEEKRARRTPRDTRTGARSAAGRTQR